MGSEEGNSQQYKTFRTTYPEFIYDRYEIEETEHELIVTYHFRIVGLSEFAPVWRFPQRKKKKTFPGGKKILLGVAEKGSYFLKNFLPPLAR